MDPIVNRPNPTQPLPQTPLARAYATGTGEIAPLAAPDVVADTNRVETGGLAGAVARATVGEYVPAPDVPTRSKPAELPTQRENFKLGAMEATSLLNTLGGYFGGIAQLDPKSSHDFYLRIGGLLEAIDERMHPTRTDGIGQDTLLAVTRAATEIRATVREWDRVDEKEGKTRYVPDPTTEKGLGELEGLFTKLNTALDISSTPAKEPSLTTNFKQAAMEEVSMLNRLMGFFDPVSQLDPATQPLFRKIAGMTQALNDKLFDVLHPAGMLPADLLTVLKASRDIRVRLDELAKDKKLPDIKTSEGLKEIESLFKILPVFIAYKPIELPSDRSNFKLGAMEATSLLNTLGGYFGGIAQLDPKSSHDLYLRIGGLLEAIDERMDPARTDGIGQDTLLAVTRVATEIRATVREWDRVDEKEGKTRYVPDPTTEKGMGELEGLFTKLNTALDISSTPVKEPSLTTNFKQAAMEEVSMLNRLMGFFDPVSQLEPATQPLFRKLAGMTQALNDKLFDVLHPAGMLPADLLTVLKASRDIRARLDELAKDNKLPDIKTSEGLKEIESLFKILPVFIAYKPIELPSDRSNFKLGAMEATSLLNTLGGYFGGIAQLEPKSSHDFYLRIAGLLEAIDERMDPTRTDGIGQDTLLAVTRAATEIRATVREWDRVDEKEGKTRYVPDPTTEKGLGELEGLFTKLNKALDISSTPAKEPSQQDNFRNGAMETVAILNRLGALFTDQQRYESASQPTLLKIAGLVNTIGERLLPGKIASLHPANLATLLRNSQSIRAMLGDKDRVPKPGDAAGLKTIDDFVTNLAKQIGLPFA